MIQLHETMLTRHCTMIVGPTGGGKSVVLNTLVKAQTAMGISTKCITLNPKVRHGFKLDLFFCAVILWYEFKKFRDRAQENLPPISSLIQRITFEPKKHYFTLNIKFLLEIYLLFRSLIFEIQLEFS